jgi:hypothetical protein
MIRLKDIDKFAIRERSCSLTGILESNDTPVIERHNRGP